VWVSTGNECDPTVDTCPAGNQIGHALSIVHLTASLKFLQAWQVPGAVGHGHDWDFGSSPTLFGTGAPAEVGACNKNGTYYALTASPLGSTPLWADKIGAATIGGPFPARRAAVGTGECIASAVWDAPAGTLYLGGNTTTIGGTRYGGSVRLASPATGAYTWQTGLPCAVEGTPSLDAAGVLAAGTYDFTNCAPQGAYLLNAATGAMLIALPVGSAKVFAQPAFAQQTLFIATETNGLYNFAP